VAITIDEDAISSKDWAESALWDWLGLNLGTIVLIGLICVLQQHSVDWAGLV